MKKLASNRELILVVIIVLMVLGVGIRNPEFLSLKSIRDIFTDNSLLMMLVIGQMMVILTKGIDLSIASNIAFTGMAVALLNLAFPDFPIAGIIIMAAVIGFMLGAFNGLFVSVFNIPPIVVTLGTMSIYRGLTFLLSGGEWVNAHEMSASFQGVPQYTFLGLSSMIWCAAATILSALVFLGHTRTGRSIYGLGGNPIAAQYVGIDRRRILFTVYSLNGLICGLVGYFWVARYALASSEVGMGLELEAIAGCVIGGVSIAGGVGAISGALLGALFLGVIGNALPVLNVSPFWQMAISGGVILMAVIINSREEKQKGKIILRKAIKSSG